MFHLSLKAARINADMKQTEVAEKIGVGVNSIINWENNLVSIPAERLKQLGELYCVPVKYLLGEKEIIQGFERVLVTTNDNEVIADITAMDVICKEGYKVQCLHG